MALKTLKPTNGPMTITLTAGERNAIDWVGGRYAHGFELYEVLWGPQFESFPANADWDDDTPITFVENHGSGGADSVRQIGEQSNYLWDCFTPELAQKLTDFCEKVQEAKRNEGN